MGIFTSLLILLLTMCAVHGQQTLVDVSTQSTCTESAVQLGPSGENAWAQAGLDVYVDRYLRCGTIIAFKLQWFAVGSGR